MGRFKFKEAIGLRFQDIRVEVIGIDIRAAFDVRWMTQVAEIGSSQGMYDYLRKVVLTGPGQHQYHLTLNTETWGQPVPIEEVPPRLLVPMDQRIDPNIPLTEVTVGMVKNLPQGDPKDAPNLDAFVASEDTEDGDDAV